MFEDELYFADTTKMAIIRVNKFPKRGLNTTTVWSTDMELTGIKIEHPVLQRFTTRGDLINYPLFYICFTQIYFSFGYS